MAEMSIESLISKIEQGWDDFQAYINTLSEAQLTQPTDAAGWTAKDHLIHLAVWEDGIVAMLDKQRRYERMGVPQDVWSSGDFDAINEVIYQRHKAMSSGEVRATLQQVHGAMMAKLRTLTTADIHRPCTDYNPESTSDAPVIGWIVGDTYEHYAEHQPWIEAIVQAGSEPV